MTAPQAVGGPIAPRGLSGREVSLALLVVLIWGLNFIAMKWALRSMGPMLLGAVRFAVASLPFMLWVRRPQVPGRFLVAGGLLQGVGQFGLLFTALQFGMPAGLASVVLQAQAVFTLLLAVPLLGERAGPRQWAGLGVSALGLALIAAAHGDRVSAMTLTGFALTLGAALLWALSNLVVRRMGRAAPGYDAQAYIVWSSAVSVLPLVALALLIEGPAATQQSLAGFGWREALAVAFLAWGATVLAYTLWTRLLQRHPVGQVAPFSLLVPVVGLVSAHWVFGERLSPLQWTGTAAVLGGLGISQGQALRGVVRTAWTALGAPRVARATRAVRPPE